MKDSQNHRLGFPPQEVFTSIESLEDKLLHEALLSNFEYGQQSPQIFKKILAIARELANQLSEVPPC